MNVQKIFEALQNDMDNSALGIICAELESQGYSVSINGKKISSNGFFNDKYSAIENTHGSFHFLVEKSGTPEQAFDIEFNEYHEILIRRTEI